MKKYLSLLLALIMVLTLCACTNNQANNEPGETVHNTEDAGNAPETPGNSETETTQPVENNPTAPPTEAPPTQAPTEAEPTDPAPTQPAECSHNWKAATCTIAKTCSKCGQTSGKALGHSYKQATCTAAKTCSVCGTTSGSALGHSWNDATCEAPKTCGTCGSTEGAALDHDWLDATCQAPMTCDRCGATEGELGDCVWVDATCQTPKTCSLCGATDGDVVDHEFESNGKCKYCQQILPVSPDKIKSRKYVYCQSSSEICPGYSAVTLTTIDFANMLLSSAGYIDGDYYRDNEYNFDHPRFDNPLYYNEKDYYIEGGSDRDFTCQISGNRIIIDFYGEILELELLSNDTLRVVAQTDSSIPVGAIFS